MLEVIFLLKLLILSDACEEELWGKVFFAWPSASLMRFNDVEGLVSLLSPAATAFTDDENDEKRIFIAATLL